jgi:putative endonuclease
MSTRAALGRRGEDAAARLYLRLGFDVVARNCRLPRGEIDLIARRGSLLVFCEVKTRVTDRFGQPSEAVGYRKRARVRQLAAAWLARHPAGRCEIRFDVVSVIVRGDRLSLDHIENAF